MRRACSGGALLELERNAMNLANLQTILPWTISLLLIWAMATDLRQRVIPDWVTAIILVLAPLMWVATGLIFWPDIAIRLAIACGAFAAFAAIFATGRMGGGDVKLISALSLWFATTDFIWFLLIMSLIGGALSLILLIDARLRRRPTPDVPYGIAIGLSAMGLFLHPLI